MRLLPLSSRITAKLAAPTVKVAQLLMPASTDEPMDHRFISGPSPSIEKTNTLGSWLISTVSAMPFM